MQPAVAVANVSQHGFWRLIGSSEKFVPFAQFPWFQQATIGQLLNVELPSPHHLYWPELDIDLAVESIDYPEKFPLLSKEPNKKTTRVRRKAPSTSRI